jgi:hypothetical protein
MAPNDHSPGDKEIDGFIRARRASFSFFHERARELESAVLETVILLHSAVTIAVNTPLSSLTDRERKRHESSTAEAEIYYTELCEILRGSAAYHSITPSQRGYLETTCLTVRFDEQ